MANMIYEKSTKLPKTSKSAFIYIKLGKVSYINVARPSALYTIEISNYFGSDADLSSLKSIAQSLVMKYNDEMRGENDTKGFTGIIGEYVRKLYKEVPKPAVVYTYHLNAKGEIVELPIRQSDKIAGLDFYNFIFVEDKRIKRIIDVYNNIRIANTTLNTLNNAGVFLAGNEAIERAKFELEKLIERKDLIIDDIQTNPPSDEDLEVIDHQIKESFLETSTIETTSDGKIKYNSVARQFVRWRLKEYVSDGFYNTFPEGFLQNSPDNKVFETGRNEVNFAKGKEKIDNIGLALSPSGLDFIADAFGAVYCFANNAPDEALLYVGFAVIPVADKAVKIVDKASDFLRKVPYAYEIKIGKGNRLYMTFFPISEIAINTLFKNIPVGQLDIPFLQKVRALEFSKTQIKALDADFLNNVALFNAMKADHTLLQTWKEVKYLTIHRKEINFLKSFIPSRQTTYKHVPGELNIETKTYGYKIQVKGFHIQNSEVLLNPPLYGNAGIPNPANTNSPIIVSIGTLSNPTTKGKYRISDIKDYISEDMPYTAKIDVEIPEFSGNFFTKSGKDGKNVGNGRSSMFPKSWDLDKIAEETAYARSKMTSANSVIDPATGNPTQLYKRMNSENTFEIQMYIDDINDYSSNIGSTFPKVD
jgi:hypothetical protein